MIQSTVRSVVHLVGALCLGLALAVSALGWRLTQGPISLDFLTPFIETALTQGDFSVSLDTTVLALGQDDRLVEIRAINVNAYAAGYDAPVASVPEMALSLSARALLNGVIAPKSIFMYKPRLRLVRDLDDHLQWSIGPQAETPPPADKAPPPDILRALAEALVGDPIPGQPGRHLNRAAVIDADLQIIDNKTGISWHAPSADVDVRRVLKGLQATIRLSLDLNGQLGALRAAASFDKTAESYDLDVMLSGLRPASFAPLGGLADHLRAADFPLAGRVQLRGDVAHGVNWLGFEISGDAGTLTLPAPINAQYTLTGLTLRGQAMNRLSSLRVDEASLDLGNTRVAVTAQADGIGGDATIKVQANAYHVLFDDLPHLWPEIVARNARDWVVANLSKGVVHEANAKLELRLPGMDANRLVIDHVSGGLYGEGAQVDYLRPMPPVRNGKASASFDADAFRITIQSGDVYGLKANEGTIVLGGLSAPDQFADIDLGIVGPATDALKLIDNKPLRYAQALGIDPQTVGGQATTRLKLKFPLLKNLRLDDVGVKAHAKVKDVFLPKVVMGQDLTHGDLDIEVDAKGLDASGPIVLGTIAGDLKWRENFSLKGTQFRSRYQLQAKSIDEAQRKALGLDGPPFVSPFISGPVAAAVDVRLYGGGKGDIDAKIDLSPSYMSLPGLGWRKETRTTGRADVSVHLERLKLSSIPRFEVMAGDLVARGAVAFDGDGNARRVEFSRVSYGGRTEVEGTLSLRPGGGLDIDARGSSFNGEPLIAKGEETPQEAEQRAQDRAKSHRKKDDLPPMGVSLAVKTLWLSKDGKLSDASANLQRDSENWHHITLKGTVDGGAPFQAALRPGPNKTRTVKVSSSDAGAVLRAFDTYEHMMGGTLEVEGAYDDSKDDQPLSGTIHITDYHVVNAPTLARLLTVAALTGIVDVLQGQGVGFSNLDAPFTLSDGLLAVKSARAWGPALGLTATGEVDLDRSRMALEGTVVPAYAINSMLGNLPVIGWLVTGGEKGGGLVAFNFSMRGPTQDPDVLVNPLSAFTPGFLRNLFNIFDNGSETEARKRPPPTAPAAPPPEAEQK